MDVIYLDNAATSFPKPPCVGRAMAGALASCGANPGRAGHKLALAAGRIVEGCREELAAMLAMPGHKGLLGPHGTGALWVKQGVQLAPLRQGGTGSASESMLQPEMMPDALESGTLNLPGIAGLRAGMKEALCRRKEAHERAAELCDGMREAQISLPGVQVYTQRRASLLSFNVQGVSSQEAAAVLDSEGIAVRGGLHCAPGTHRFLGTLNTGAVRVSPGLYSDRKDAEALVRAVEKMCR